MGLRYILLIGMVCASEIITAQNEDFESLQGKNKVSLDIFSLLGGRNSALSSEIGFAYNRSLPNRHFEVSGRIAYSTLNILAGGREVQDSLGNDTANTKLGIIQVSTDRQIDIDDTFAVFEQRYSQTQRQTDRIGSQCESDPFEKTTTTTDRPGRRGHRGRCQQGADRAISCRHRDPSIDRP